jgi:isopenicillin-N N-acyltransferase like protein
LSGRPTGTPDASAYPLPVGQPIVVDLPASPRARGEAHGEHLRELIGEGIARWKDSLGPQPDVWITRFLHDTDFVPAIEATTPDLLDEVRGIAAAAGVREHEMLAYQLVDEQWCYTLRKRIEHEHCSTIGGPGFVAQNLDLPIWWDGLQTVLRIPPHGNEPGCIVVTAAGFIVMNGMNDAGVAIGVNALPDLPAVSHGLPVAFAIRGALAKRSAADAVAFLRSVDHASGQNYIVGDRDEVLGVECDAQGSTAYGDGRRLAHTNHSVVRTAHASDEGVAAGALANSCARLDFLNDFDGNVTELLSDSTVPIRRVPTSVSPSATFATVVFELGDAPRALVRGGPSEESFVDVEPLAVAVP